MSRDTTNSVNVLGKIFDKKTVQEQQELAKVFGEEAFKAVGDLGLEENDPKKVALKAVVGGIMSQFAGGSFASGATSAGFTQIIQNQLANIKDPATLQWVSGIIGAVASKLVGGNGLTGGSISISDERNNFLSHWQKQQRQQAMDVGDTKTVAYWDLIDAAQDQICNDMGINPNSIDWENPDNAGLLQTVSIQAQNLAADPDFQNSWLVKKPSFDSSILSKAVLATAVIVGGYVICSINGNWVRIASASSIGVDPNKLNHIFGKAEHNLGPFLAKYWGNQVSAYVAIQKAAQEQIIAKGITGVFEETVNVGGELITVRGNVVDGVVKVGTAFIP
ncbi:DUF637 domain-containing protein [Sporomusa acidovorans]|uniref:DUF637 domain-containing protein n=1 Tax=Sporomusa acidovorans (strain ATCC 49682 / DSM 3132 / Mol) TaxID=1123286 RepID=A0ABZ3J8W2_SPOA4|nr:DUF637 domain-containing protein [Sporomusa acidovorans]OZC14435.1 hypothetical protein SPACI_52720 [Sporomusa acidovorans DSM 3132]SDF86819.1 hypothetical protein SAMN04488499_11092 [Sporomusa acidovorans]